MVSEGETPHVSSEGHSVKNVSRIRLENVTLCIKLAKTLVGLDWIRRKLAITLVGLDWIRRYPV